MFFVERAKADLLKIQEILKAGFYYYAYWYLLPESSRLYRQQLIMTMSEAIDQVANYGDDNLYVIYLKAVRELQIGEIRNILLATLDDIEQGKIQRQSGQVKINACVQVSKQLESENVKLYEANQNLVIKIAHLQIEQPGSSSNYTDEEQHLITQSMFFKLDESIPNLVAGFLYQKASVEMSTLVERCVNLNENSSDHELKVFVDSFNKINKIFANQIVDELKKSFSTIRFFGIFSDEKTRLYAALAEQLRIVNIYQLITQGFIQKKEDMMLLVNYLREEVLLYEKGENFKDLADDYARLIVKESITKFIQSFEQKQALSSESAYQALLQQCIVVLKKERDSIVSLITELKKTNLDSAKIFLGEKARKSFYGLMNAPLDYLFNTVELLLSPATAVAKQLGQTMAEYKHAHSKLPNQQWANVQIEQLTEMLNNIDKIITVIEKVIQSVQEEHQLNPLDRKMMLRA